MTAEEIENWLAIRKEAGLHIDPETAEVDWTYGLTLDPYGIYPELPEEYEQVGREYFARTCVGQFWRPARSDPRCLVGKAPEKLRFAVDLA